MTEKIKNKLTVRLYEYHQNLATQYSYKIFNYERYGYEREDLIQELRIKLFSCIKTYLNKFEEYKTTGRYKPIPLEFYLKCAMRNKVNDYIKQFNKESVENVDKISLEDNNFDTGIHNTSVSTFNLEECICEINGVNLFHNLSGAKKACFSLFLQGHTIRELKKKVVKPKFDFSWIEEQLTFIRNNKNILLDYDRLKFRHLEYSEQ